MHRQGTEDNSSTQHYPHLISLSTFMVEQLTEVIRDNLTMRSCLFLFLGTYATILIPIGGIIAISFIKIWSLRFGIPAICSVVATLIFLSGSGSYNCVKPQGRSSLTTVFRVLVAATSKMFHKCPEEADRLYEMVLIFIWSLTLVA
ncbi:Protein NRT1/ PTR FAMILY 5.5 [Camellia lanceoleosa]|uniref:Protein NRT1/ PTR FAMILY 5.5 n=1 Tax=Camellia lanceoleosa TaxID=1840588 RepID=A0ACC0G7R3_9ERIC|nr:Protein NRT1/ PTR FAMILY 5.5 [Camellia lanceoleosa]